ncbi:putative carboxypeptidase S1 [Aaosphaeria arxii CBS 175.79]|uniref:Carboxypeptidase n=1 Tax=Aaosphaeria arxii CBS 175.79 TaxID=1450172 RepID=A0A6A5XDV3_9PLEO|nr:putative carboxypeptidase S1 [Aaosphaeria arxii CBS 175.79]KAF2011208.1 putative carboxypeptidase S1 [Aaosphaeria arxii CBS 175.79]
MFSFLTYLALTLVLPLLTTAVPPARHDKRSVVERSGVLYNVFEHAKTGARIEFVNNSGICETTPGVKQYSGYLSVGENMNMWFWFFEARQNPETAPLAAWFNGGPGCSSMIGLFQENGPCKFEVGVKNTVPVNNTHSFNNYANMIYIDQPIGVGFSYGTNNVTSTVTAAPYVWKLIQAFYTSFPQYKSRDFGIFTESYGGHYGPDFAKYVQDQNAAKVGEPINIVALGINNGWHDAAIQEPAYISYSYNNSHRPIISKTQYDRYMSRYEDYCLPDIQACARTGSNTDCQNADRACYAIVERPLYSAADYDVYDIRAPSNNPEPPSNYKKYLEDPTVVKAIGAQSSYQECPTAAYNKFTSSGDGPRSFMSQLSSVVSSGVTTLIWAGDADWICNWYGVFDVANSILYPEQDAFKSKPLAPYKFNGNDVGAYKTEGSLSFLRVYNAGHEVMYYQPELSLHVFKQTMQKGAIVSRRGLSP